MSNSPESLRARDLARTQRNLNPHKAARLAMLVWHDEYAAQGGGSMDFYDSLTAFQKRQLLTWLKDIDDSPKAPAAPAQSEGAES